jgi:hypothetical protein
LPLFIEAVEALLDWLGLLLDVEAMLGELTRRFSRHVGGFPCENISILMHTL